MSAEDARRGFALVLMVVLLGMLVLIAYALATLGRINTQSAGAAVQRMQARQHALAALAQAMGELQALAGPDDRITGMAGVVGIAAGKGRSTRNWCGIWSSDGDFLGWLVSGAEAATAEIGASESFGLMGAGSLGADNTDKEHVAAGLLPVSDEDSATAPRGRMAWWIGDEGIKLSARIPEETAPWPGAKHASDELVPQISPDAAALQKLELIEQCVLVPPDALTPSSIQSNLHALTRTHLAVDDDGRVIAGRLNVNTTNFRFWRGVAATYNRMSPVDQRLGMTTTTFAQRMRDRMVAAEGPGKRRAGPFLSVEAFLRSELLAEVLHGADVTPEDFAEVIGAWLAVRSDTFRIRAYGDARNRSDHARIEAAACCEAMVQRTPNPTPGHGRRFEVISFRWLGPEEI